MGKRRERLKMLRIVWMGIACILLLPLGSGEARAQQTVGLTLERAVELATGSSYRVRHLEMGIEQTRARLRAERAGLKSQVYLNLNTPDIAALSEQKWNSTLGRDETIRENTRRWQANLSVRQPVILFGYPTNGYLSLNNRVYRYVQIAEEGGRDVTYYNRYFIQYDQPLFQPNRLKNDLERAELNLDNAELDFQRDLVNLIDDIADDYFRLFELSYEQEIQSETINQLAQAEVVAREVAAEDSTRRIDLSQVVVELANAREQLNQLESQYRLESSRMKRRLGLSESDSILIDPQMEVVPIAVDVNQALEYGKTLLPRLQQLQINRRREQLDLINTRGQNSFRANLSLTYGREMENPYIEQLWHEPTNSYSVGLSAYVPIWDWGQRRARIQADRLSVERSELSIEEAELEIESEITLAVQNLNEYQQRAVAMQNNLSMANDIAAQSLARYEAGVITILDLLQSFRRQADTAENFLDAYLGYRQALLSLQQNTYYDFERDVPLLRRFGVTEAQPVE